jgi:hypothetical protein
MLKEALSQLYYQLHRLGHNRHRHLIICFLEKQLPVYNVSTATETTAKDA